MKKITLLLLITVCLISFSQNTASAQQIQNIREEHRISADFTDADIRNVLTVLCTDTGYNLAFSEDIQSRVSIKFNSVPVRVAIDAVVSACGFTYTVSENVINVTTAKQLKTLNKIKEITRRDPETIPNVFHLNYINAEDIIPIIRTQLTPKGKVEIIKQNENYSNALVITDIPQAIEKAKYILDNLDAKPQEVLIQTRIIAISETDKDNIRKNNDVFGQMFSPSPNNPNILKSEIIQSNNIEQVIEQLNLSGKIMVLLDSSIRAVNNYTTDFSLENCFPQTEKDKKNALNLSFTPRINKNKDICLYLEPTVYEPTEKTGLNFKQKHRKQNFKTQMILKSGQTIAIGGFRKYLESSEYINKGLTGIATYPILERFATKKPPTKITHTEKTEVLILITPYILLD